MKLQLIRDEVMDDGVYGHIDIIGDRDSHRLGTIENLNYLIPPGTYPLKHTWSPKFQKFMTLIDEVPDREGIRIHTGTKPSHSTGCVLLSTFGVSMIETTIKTAQNHGEEITLDVIGDL
jgi:hypothetical protein